MRRIVLTLLALAAGLPVAAQGVRKTADEFNKMSRSDTSLVMLHGVVTRPRANDQRGVFYLQDETGEAYIYGLEDGRPGSNQSFLRMGIAPGDTLTVSGRRTVYNGTTIEMAGGHLLRKADGPRHAEILESMKAPDKYPSFKGKGTDAFAAWVSGQAPTAVSRRWRWRRAYILRWMPRRSVWSGVLRNGSRPSRTASPSACAMTCR